ncbi:protease modulator HflC [Pigmentiphaga sp. GD03639]|uniref:protease modulator HflC n=1 Tax=unclassified Pigmentiphaga TaxID=2626614 RepID=UPI000B41155B|nr:MULTISPECIES: protease modulator HflC [unclassified Pigmentiphaga]MDH2235590.1 protease modulator HflC [Pigmentiphaga sp. GD03639]OVZ61628.1 HflC protein [Pigmentiphaga sp. NML030171]
MDRLIPAVIGLLVGVAVLSSCVFVVNERNYAVVFALGEIKEVIDEPGLYFKLPPPFQNVQQFDKRILTIDSADSERVQTSEKKNLLIDAFVKWRISNPRTYYVTFGGNERAAQERLLALIRDALNASINRRTVNDVTSKERDKIMQEIRTNTEAAAKLLGVEIVDVRLKRVDFVPEISESVYRRMEAERKRVANEQRSIGAAEGEKIRADADRQREVILAEAYRKAQEIKGEGDAKASAVYAQAFGQDRDFYRFYKSLEAYRSSFGSKSDMLVVDPSSEFFRFMKSPAAN